MHAFRKPLHRVRVLHHIQATFSGQLARPLRYERHLVGTDFQGDTRHFVGHGHLDVQLRADAVAKRVEVCVLDVTAVRAQMDGDAIGARSLGDQRGGKRVRLLRLPRLSNRRDVIDVYG